MRLIEKMDKDRNKKFDALVKRHRDLIWHVCADYSLSAAWEVQDAVQEVLCVLWRDFETFSGRSSERTWVYRVASNTMISLKRRQNNVPQAVLEEVAEDYDLSFGRVSSSRQNKRACSALDFRNGDRPQV